jgi:hypothetical protein
VGTNTNQRNNTCATNSTGYATWLAPASGATLVCGGSDMGGNAGSQDNIEVYRLEINTSTLALTAGTNFNSGDVVVANGHFWYDMVASNELYIVKGGTNNNNYNQIRRIVLNDPATNPSSDINGFGDFFLTGTMGFYNVLLGLPLKNGNGNAFWSTHFGDTALQGYVSDSSGATFYATTTAATTTTDERDVDVDNACQVDSTDKFCHVRSDVSAKQARLRLVDPAFSNPAAAPTVNSGTVTSVAYNNGFNVCSGFNNDEFYGVDYNGTTLSVIKFTASGTTLTQGLSQTFTLGATPSTTSGSEVDVFNSVTRCRDTTNSRNMIAGAYTDSSGNCRVWATKYLL